MCHNIGHFPFWRVTFVFTQNVLSWMRNGICEPKMVAFHFDDRPFTIYKTQSVNKLWDVVLFSITIFKGEWLLCRHKTRSSRRRVSFVCEQRSFLLTPNNLFQVKKVVPHFAEWVVSIVKGRSARWRAGKSAKTGRSASWGRGVLPVKSRSSARKVGFVCEQKPFLAATSEFCLRTKVVRLNAE